jgi:hypothetical protein
MKKEEFRCSGGAGIAGFCGFLQSVQENAGIVPRLSPTMPFTINYSPPS